MIILALRAIPHQRDASPIFVVLPVQAILQREMLKDGAEEHREGVEMADGHEAALGGGRHLVANFFDQRVLVVGRSVLLFDEIVHLDLYVLDVVLGLLELGFCLALQLFEMLAHCSELFIDFAESLLQRLF